MVHHIVSWNVKEEYTQSKEEVMNKIKDSLEALTDVVPGIISIHVLINKMQSSTVDLTLMCEFETVDALNAYQVSDGHVKAAGFIKQVLCNRTCIDYEV